MVWTTSQHKPASHHSPLPSQGGLRCAPARRSHPQAQLNCAGFFNQAPAVQWTPNPPLKLLHWVARLPLSTAPSKTLGAGKAEGGSRSPPLADHGLMCPEQKREGCCGGVWGALGRGLWHVAGVWKRSQPVPPQRLVFLLCEALEDWEAGTGKMRSILPPAHGPVSRRCLFPPTQLQPGPCQPQKHAVHPSRGRLLRVRVEFLTFLEDKS